MAKDDYHVIAYKILSYLYTQLKKGKAIDVEMILYEGKQFIIPERYWNWIITELSVNGFIDGVQIKRAKETDEIWTGDLDNIRITLKGVEYLTDDKFMKKVKEELSCIETISE